MRSEFLHFNIFFIFLSKRLTTCNAAALFCLSCSCLFIFFFTVKDHVPLNEHRRNKRKAKRAARLQQRAVDTMETDEDRLNSALVRWFFYLIF